MEPTARVKRKKGRGAVKLAPLRRHSRGERGHVKLCPLCRHSRKRSITWHSHEERLSVDPSPRLAQQSWPVSVLVSYKRWRRQEITRLWCASFCSAAMTVATCLSPMTTTRRMLPYGRTLDLRYHSPVSYPSTSRVLGANVRSIPV